MKTGTCKYCGRYIWLEHEEGYWECEKYTPKDSKGKSWIFCDKSPLQDGAHTPVQKEDVFDTLYKKMQ